MAMMTNYDVDFMVVIIVAYSIAMAISSYTIPMTILMAVLH